MRLPLGQFQFSLLLRSTSGCALIHCRATAAAAAAADMNKTLYNHSEYRCGLAILGVDGFRISDVTISDTGGDGCAFNTAHPWSVLSVLK